jgi:hypothetical protein
LLWRGGVQALCSFWGQWAKAFGELACQQLGIAIGFALLQALFQALLFSLLGPFNASQSISAVTI